MSIGYIDIKRIKSSQYCILQRLNGNLFDKKIFVSILKKKDSFTSLISFDQK